MTDLLPDLGWTVGVETPALLLDVGILDRNIAEMAALASSFEVDLWPHLKSHKSEAVGRRQLVAGARGLTCQTLGEVEVAIAGGAPRVLLARPVVSGPALARLARLAKASELTVAVDSGFGIDAIAAACKDAGARVKALIEVDCAYRRCGAVPEAVPALAERIESAAPLELSGVMAYEGQIYECGTLAEAASSATATYDLLGQVADALRAQGHAAPRVSAGASAVASTAAAHPAITELRCGSYALRDRTQLELGATARDRCALRVLATVISRPEPTRFVIDAGAKSLSFVTVPGAEGYGEVEHLDGVVFDRLADEHGLGTVPAPSNLAVGDRVTVIPNAHPSVVAGAESFVLHRGDELAGHWPIDRRR